MKIIHNGGGHRLEYLPIRTCFLHHQRLQFIYVQMKRHVFLTIYIYV